MYRFYRFNFDWDYRWIIYSMLWYVNQKLISLMPKLHTRCITISKRIITFLSSFIIIFTEIPLIIGIHPRIVSKFSYDSNEKTFHPTGFFHWLFVNMHGVTSRKKIMIFKSTRVCDTRGNDLLITPPIETLESLK